MALTEPMERTPDDVPKLRRLDEVTFHSSRSDASWELAQQLSRRITDSQSRARFLRAVSKDIQAYLST